MTNNLTAVSLFSGCGGFDWGVQQAGIDIIWANDIDPHAAFAYQSIFPDVNFSEDDIANIKDFPRADVLIGCYPCTGFSLGSRRRAKTKDIRDLQLIDGNFLYKEFLRAIKIVQPKYLFVENVKGMLSADKGWFFEEQIKGFKNLGYRIQFAKLDASHYGVPQSRERVFIVGVRKDVKDFDYKFSTPTHGEGPLWQKKVFKDNKHTCRWSLLAKRAQFGDYEAEVMPMTSLLSAIGGKTWADDEYLELAFHGHYLTRNRKRSWDNPSYTIVANYHHIPLHPSGKPMRYVATDKWELQGSENRRLSWRECAAIQGLPETCLPSGRLEDKYRVIGNAVPPSFGRILLAPIVEYELSL